MDNEFNYTPTKNELYYYLQFIFKTDLKFSLQDSNNLENFKLNGANCVAFLLKSNLEAKVLRWIWNCVDPHGEGELHRIEQLFGIFLLISILQSNHQIVTGDLNLTDILKLKLAENIPFFDGLPSFSNSSSSSGGEHDLNFDGTFECDSRRNSITEESTNLEQNATDNSNNNLLDPFSAFDELTSSLQDTPLPVLAHTTPFDSKTNDNVVTTPISSNRDTNITDASRGVGFVATNIVGGIMDLYSVTNPIRGSSTDDDAVIQSINNGSDDYGIDCANKSYDNNVDDDVWGDFEETAPLPQQQQDSNACPISEKNINDVCATENDTVVTNDATSNEDAEADLDIDGKNIATETKSSMNSIIDLYNIPQHDGLTTASIDDIHSNNDGSIELGFDDDNVSNENTNDYINQDTRDMVNEMNYGYLNNDNDDKEWGEFEKTKLPSDESIMKKETADTIIENGIDNDTDHHESHKVASGCDCNIDMNRKSINECRSDVSRDSENTVKDNHSNNNYIDRRQGESIRHAVGDENNDVQVINSDDWGDFENSTVSGDPVNDDVGIDNEKMGENSNNDITPKKFESHRDENGEFEHTHLRDGNEESSNSNIGNSCGINHTAVPAIPNAIRQNESNIAISNTVDINDDWGEFKDHGDDEWGEFKETVMAQNSAEVVHLTIETNVDNKVNKTFGKDTIGVNSNESVKNSNEIGYNAAETDNSWGGFEDAEVSNKSDDYSDSYENGEEKKSDDYKSGDSQLRQSGCDTISVLVSLLDEKNRLPLLPSGFYEKEIQNNKHQLSIVVNDEYMNDSGQFCIRLLHQQLVGHDNYSHNVTENTNGSKNFQAYKRCLTLYCMCITSHCDIMTKWHRIIDEAKVLLSEAKEMLQIEICNDGGDLFLKSMLEGSSKKLTNYVDALRKVVLLCRLIHASVLDVLCFPLNFEKESSTWNCSLVDKIYKVESFWAWIVSSLKQLSPIFTNKYCAIPRIKDIRLKSMNIEDKNTPQEICNITLQPIDLSFSTTWDNKGEKYLVSALNFWLNRCKMIKEFRD